MPYIRDAAAAQLREELELAARCGVPTLTFHPGRRGKRIPPRRSFEFLLETLSRVMDTLRSVRETTVLCMENMDKDGTKMCRTIEEIREVLREFPLVMVTCDLAHLGQNGVDIPSFLAECGERIRHFHVSGVDGDKSHSRVSLADSRIALHQYLVPYSASDITVCVENKTIELARSSLQVLRRLTRNSTETETLPRT